MLCTKQNKTDKILWSSNILSPHYPSMSILTNTKHKGPNNDTCASKEKVKRVNE